MRKIITLTLVTLIPFLVSGRARAGQIDYWAGNGNANDGTGPNSGTLVDGVAFGPGVLGQAFQFDGNSYVQSGTVGMPTGDSDRTLALFFKVDAFGPGEAFLAGYGDFGSFDSTYALGVLDDGSVFFSQWGDGLVGPSISAGTWHHLAVTNVGGLATLYLDGVSVGSKTMSINTAAGTNFYMGRLAGSLGDTRQLMGSVDEVKLFDQALSADQIHALATVPEPSSLVLAASAGGVVGLMLTSRRRRNR